MGKRRTSGLGARGVNESRMARSHTTSRLFGRKKSQHMAMQTQRLLDRDSVFRQSGGKWNINRLNRHRMLYFNDIFHTLLNQTMWKIVLVIFALYLGAFVLFAALYLAVSEPCNLGVTNFMDAYYFSVETMLTIGYSTQNNDIFFDGCVEMVFLLSLQSMIGIYLNAMCVGIIFARFSRAQTRATTVIFSDKAVVREIAGHLYLMFQVCEMRKHQLVEAHVRCYAVRHVRKKTKRAKRRRGEKGNAGVGGDSHASGEEEDDDDDDDEEIMFQSHAMRLSHPDDELGATLLMCLPSVIVHRIDAWSPLLPPGGLELGKADGGPGGPGGLGATGATGARGGGGGGGEETHQPAAPHSALNSYRFPEILQREADAEAGSRDAFACEFCGETYGTMALLQRHIKFSCTDDMMSGHNANTVCQICGEAFISPHTLDLHMRTQHEDEGAETIAAALAASAKEARANRIFHRRQDPPGGGCEEYCPQVGDAGGGAAISAATDDDREGESKSAAAAAAGAGADGQGSMSKAKLREMRRSAVER